MGFFITIEGVEGAGKSTAIGFIRQWFKQSHIVYQLTREPGGTPLAEHIRGLLLAEHDEPVFDTTELLLLFAARSQNMELHIKPALEEGKVVLCDRFTDATYAYQSGGRGMDEKDISVLENLVQGVLRPDLTLLLDIDPLLGLERAGSRGCQDGGQLDRIEKENPDFFIRVRQAYLDRAQRYPEQYEIVDASGAIEQVHQQIRVVLERRMGAFVNQQGING
ncbi:Thymidylate kinase [invertebrate metagenome]|uniref:dTMP kinase n=1 Tax=invertebrate metagenome TaxID=1711999 RepID=A0A2H9T9M0_9ZZZZ